MADNRVYLADNLKVLKDLPNESVDLIAIDPPFNTGKLQTIHGIWFDDKFDSYIDFLRPRMEEAYRVLSPTGALYFHIDYRESAYCRIMLDEIFGRESFLNEIIWAYDYGARSKSRWSAKHDNILYYVKNPKRYTFNFDAMDRIPYMAPGLVGPEKAARGKTPTSVWFNTIVHTNGKERVGYPTQKPLAIYRRIVKISSNEGDMVLDFFAGSGTTGHAAIELGRKFILVDNNFNSFVTMQKRLSKYDGIEYINLQDTKSWKVYWDGDRIERV